MIRRLARRYRRWRHTRGFGIHSPYAFALLTDALRPGRRYAYYGDADIDAAVEEWGVACEATGRRAKRVRRNARLLLRLLAATRPASLWLDPTLPAPLAVAADKAGYRPGERMATDWRQAAMIVTAGDDTRLFGAELARWLAVPRRSLLLFDPGKALADALYSALPEGLMLRAPRVVWLINRRGMRKLSYTVTL